MTQQPDPTLPLMLDDDRSAPREFESRTAAAYTRAGIDSNVASVTYFSVPAVDGIYDQSATNLLSGSKWGIGICTGVTISVSFSTDNSTYSANYSDRGASDGAVALSEAQINAARAVMASYAAVANITFSEVSESSGSAGDIRWGQTSSTSTATAFAYFPGSSVASGDIWFGPNYSQYRNPIAGQYGYYTFIHELGHAVGLGHPHEGTIAFEPGEDQLKYSVMSYRDHDGDELDGLGSGYFATTPMLNDILALQYLYGANMSYRTGNDTYQWSAGQTVYETIWDAGGNDTLDASNQYSGVALNLNAGTWSTIGAGYSNEQGYVRNTLAIAYGATIENAIGSSYHDSLTGNAAANVLDGRGGGDTMAGGNGNDVYAVDDVLDVVIELNSVSATGGVDTVSTMVTFTLPSHVEVLRLDSGAAINGTGNAQDNLILAGAGNNVIDGGQGSDTVSYAFATTSGSSGITIDLANTNASRHATVSGISGTDLLIRVENLVGTQYDDVLTGNQSNNRLEGGAGNDLLSGRTGADTMAGGAGDDNYTVNSADDVVIETDAALVSGGLDLVQSTVSFTLGANLENLRLLSSNAIDGTGNAADNLILAGGGTNIIDGKAGVDEVSFYFATSGSGAGVTLDLSLHDDLGYSTASGVSGADKVRNIENLTGSNFSDYLTGDNAANALCGGAGNDVLSGKGGNDALLGGLGNDQLTGGGGNDVFIFNILINAGMNRDAITDFEVGSDVLWLDSAVFASFAAGAVSTSNFQIGGQAVDSDDYLTYNSANGVLRYDADGSGAGSSVVIATLGTGLALTYLDFAVF